MILRREGLLQNSELGTGDILSLELQGNDIDKLLDNGYAMTRFGLMGGNSAYMRFCQGWQAEDKIHVSLSQEQPSRPEVPFSLCLDPGGDLTFSIFSAVIDSSVKACERFAAEDVVKSDPSDTLGKLGIKSVGILYLNAIDQFKQAQQWDAYRKG